MGPAPAPLYPRSLPSAAIEGASLTAERVEPEPSHRPLVSPLVVLCLAQGILQLDYSIVNLALKTIQVEVGFSTAGLQWVATSYALTFGSLLMLGGRLGDRVGRRRLLICGLGIFGVASLACGLAQSPGLLVAARFVQGAGAAMIAPTVLAMLTAIYDGPARARALGTWAASLAAGGTAGVVVGGLLTEYLGWRSIFLVNLPVIVVLIVLARQVLPDVRGDRTRSLDPIGAALITLAIAAMIFGLTSGEQHGFGAARAWIPLALFVLLSGAFFVNEKRVAEPMISLAFLAVPLRRVSTLAMFLVGGIVTAYTFFIALSMQHVLGFSPAQTGFAILPSGLIMFVTSMLLAHRLIARFGLKRTLILGLSTTGLAMLIFSQITAASGYATGVLPGMVLNSFGFGLLFPTVSIGITRNVAPKDQGAAGGLVPTAQQVGAAVVLAILATLAAAVTQQQDGSLAAGYRVGFLGTLGIVVICGAMVAVTSFSEVEEPAA
jgi:EmrB/QacA subfamily drug resistance transporter